MNSFFWLWSGQTDTHSHREYIHTMDTLMHPPHTCTYTHTYVVPCTCAHARAHPHLPRAKVSSLEPSELP